MASVLGRALARLRVGAMGAFCALLLTTSVALPGIASGFKRVQAGPIKSATGRKIALVIGISGYRPPFQDGQGAFTPLKYAHLDADRMEKKLKSLGWAVRKLVALPTGETPGPNAPQTSGTRDEILANLVDLKTQPGDTVLIYFSGHGLNFEGGEYLAPADGYFTRVTENTYRPNPETLISYEDLQFAFEGMAAEKRILILDACREEVSVMTTKGSRSAPIETAGREDFNPSKFLKVAGNAPQSGSRSAPDQKVNDKGATSKGRPSVALFFSCSRGEKSYEDGALKSGVFTNALIETIDSKQSADEQGRVRPKKLEAVLRDRVKQWVQKHNGKPMTPGVVVDESEPLVIHTVAVAKPTPPKPIKPTKPATVKPTKPTKPTTPPKPVPPKPTEPTEPIPQKLPATLVLKSPTPGAQMKVDGVIRGTRFVIELLPGDTFDVTVEVFAPGHDPVKRRVTLKAGEETPLAVSLERILPDLSRRVALVVGMNTYRPGSARLRDLEYANDDARRMSESLRGLGYEVNLLLSEPSSKGTYVDKASILAAINNLRVGPEDSVLFYFNGHGASYQGFDMLFPADTTFGIGQEIEVLDLNSVILLSDLVRALGRLGAKKTTLLLDSGRVELRQQRVGAKFSEALSRSALRTDESLFNRLVDGSKGAILFHYRLGEEKWEDRGMKGSAFLRALVTVLAGDTAIDGGGNVDLVYALDQAKLLYEPWGIMNRRPFEASLLISGPGRYSLGRPKR